MPLLTSPLSFFVAGVARPKGSHKSIVVGGEAHLIGASAKEYGWRQTVTSRAVEAMNGLPPIEGPVAIILEFFEQRPKGHFKKNGDLRPAAPLWPTKAPDADKLMRSIGDALNGVCYRDDSQICDATIRKRYTGSGPFDSPSVGVRICVGARVP